MKKRLRKKLGKGEFDYPLMPIAFRMISLGNDVRNALLDRFIIEAIEANGLQFGGGGGADIWSGFADVARYPFKIEEEQRLAVKGWLASQEEILEYFVGEMMKDSDVRAAQNADPSFLESRLAHASS